MSVPDDTPREPGSSPYPYPEHDPSGVSPSKQNELAHRLRQRPLPMAPRVTVLSQIRDEPQAHQRRTASPPRRPPRALRGPGTGIAGILLIVLVLGSASFAVTMTWLTGGEWWSAVLQRLESLEAHGGTVTASVANLDPSPQYSVDGAGKEPVISAMSPDRLLNVAILAYAETKVIGATSLASVNAESVAFTSSPH